MGAQGAVNLYQASLPSRERELKLTPEDETLYDVDVAPLAGARIETTQTPVRGTSLASLPSRERELKHLPRVRCGGRIGRSPRGSAN